MKNIDIIWFIEHISRELDVACAVSVLLEKKYGKKVKIAPYSVSKEVIYNFYPKIILLPYCYSLRDSQLGSYISRWPDSLHINLAWEQIFYKANLEYKAPQDTFAKKCVFHHVWSMARSKFLQEKGVPKSHIFVNGHPAYKLYMEPYRNVFTTRKELAKEFSIDPNKRWVFFPENYSWFFYSDYNLEEIIKNGQDRKVAYLMRDYCGQAFKEVILWLKEAVNKYKDIEIILRPRPAVSIAYFKEVLNKLLPSLKMYIHILKDYSVREWILASDTVVSSFSTSLIEAAIAQKSIYMLEPFKTPKPLIAGWYRHVKKINNKEQFLKLCIDGYQKDSFTQLSNWAKKRFLVNKDPIMGLVDYLGNLKVVPSQDQKRYVKRMIENSRPDNYLWKYVKDGIINTLGKLKRNFTRDRLYYKSDDQDIYMREIIKKIKIYQNFFKNLSLEMP